jgi:hypothetical protein
MEQAQRKVMQEIHVPAIIRSLIVCSIVAPINCTRFDIKIICISPTECIYVSHCFSE